MLDTLFDIARPNLRINGRTIDEPCGDEDGELTTTHLSFSYPLFTSLDVEPFDEALDRHIWSLSDQRLKWDKEIADRRRSRPEDIEKLVMESLAQHHVYDLEVSEKSNADADANRKLWVPVVGAVNLSHS